MVINNIFKQTLKLARELQDEEMQIYCLSNMAFSNAAQGEYRLAKKMITEVKKISVNALSSSEYQLFVKIYIDERNIDSAKYFLKLFTTERDDIRDGLTEAHLRCRIGIVDQNFKEVAEAFNEYITLGDSLTRLTLSQSATAAERRYYQEQTAFAAYRLKAHFVFECIGVVLVSIIVAFFIYYFRVKTRRNRELLERYIGLVDEIHGSKERLVFQLEQQENAQAHLKTLILSRFDILDQLGRTFYERGNTKSQQEAIYKDVKKFITDLSSNSSTKKELEDIVNAVNNNIMQKIRKQLPKIRVEDLDLLCYIYAGFSAQVISILFGESMSNIYTRKSRLKSKFIASDAPDKSLFVSSMS